MKRRRKLGGHAGPAGPGETARPMVAWLRLLDALNRAPVGGMPCTQQVVQEADQAVHRRGVRTWAIPEITLDCARREAERRAEESAAYARYHRRPEARIDAAGAACYRDRLAWFRYRWDRPPPKCMEVLSDEPVPPRGGFFGSRIRDKRRA